MKVNRFVRIVFILQISVFLVDGFLDVKLIQGYFKQKTINYATVVGCFTNRERMQLAKSLSFGNQHLAFVNVDSFMGKMKFFENNFRHIGIIVDGDCDYEELKLFLIKCGMEQHFYRKVHWLLLSNNPNFSNIFKEVELYIDADITLVRPQVIENRTDLVIEDVYNPATWKGGELKTRIFDVYNETLGFVAMDNVHKYMSRRNMTGVTLKASVVCKAPFKGNLLDYLQTKDQIDLNGVSRNQYDILNSCVEYYNFTPNITLTDSWGYVAADGTVDGVVEELRTRAIDYSSTVLLVKEERLPFAEYGRQTWVTRSGYIFRNPRRLNSLEAFVMPFTYTVWVCIIFMCLFCVVFLKYTHVSEKRHLSQTTETSWTIMIMNTMAIFCQQDLSHIPIFSSGRMTLFVMLMCASITYQFYSAVIVSSLLIEPKTMIKTVEDLLNSPLKAGSEESPLNRDFYAKTTDKMVQELYHKKILGKGNSSNFYTTKKGVELVQEGGFAFHFAMGNVYSLIATTYSDQAICELREITMSLQQGNLLVPKRSPFRDMFDTCLQRVAEGGILPKQMKYWHPTKPECIKTTVDLISLGIDYFYPLYTVFFIGILISLLILLYEIRTYKKEEDAKNVFY